jgi:uncharacterized protein (TIGR00725 family)
MQRQPRIGVLGPAVCSPQLEEIARHIGRQIASQGGILVCGGGTGVMEAAARGAHEAGGLTVGILPGARACDANPHIDIPVVTGLGDARNVINVLTSQAVIAIGGAAGTLSEIALAMKCGTPVVGLETWVLTPPPDQAPPPIHKARTPEEAVAVALRLIRGERPPVTAV